MGAAAYGDPGRYRAAMRRLLHLVEDGDYRLDLQYFEHYDFDSAGWLSRAGEALLGGPGRREGEPIDQRHHDIAAAAQERLEEALRHALGWLAERTGSPDLCLTGGVAMNSLFNGRLSVDGPFARVFVPYSPTTAATASARPSGPPASAATSWRSSGRPRRFWARPSTTSRSSHLARLPAALPAGGRPARRGRRTPGQR